MNTLYRGTHVLLDDAGSPFEVSTYEHPTGVLVQVNESTGEYRKRKPGCPTVENCDFTKNPYRWLNEDGTRYRWPEYGEWVPAESAQSVPT